MSVLLAGCVFAESETTTCPYCGAQITAEEAGDHRLPGCGVVEHAICVAGASEEHDEKCDICGSPLCVTVGIMGHTAGLCGLPGHCWEDGKAHYPAGCNISGHYECDDVDHKLANCYVAGHYRCVVGSHDSLCALCFQPNCVGEHGVGICVEAEEEPGEPCPTCGKPLNDGNDHSATDCHFKSTHRHCDGLTHDRCDICKGWLCNGSTHAPGICDYVPETVDPATIKYFPDIPEPPKPSSQEPPASQPCPHCGMQLSVGTSHKAVCGVGGHYSCDDLLHGAAGCGHSPACTLDSSHDSAPCLVHYKCMAGYRESEHSVKRACGLHFTCEHEVNNLDHNTICQSCNHFLCSDHHRYICSASS